MSRYVGAAALVALLALGCSDEHAGGLPPTTSPTASTTPSATASASLSPAAQVEAAARLYFATIEHAGQTGDVSTLDELVGTGCECRRQVDAIRSDARAGRHATTAYRIEGVRTHDVTRTVGSATVTYSSPASKLVDAKGKTVRTFPARRNAGVDLTFRLMGTAWVLERLVVLGA